MSIGAGEQIERHLIWKWEKWEQEHGKPWKKLRKRSDRTVWMKKVKARFERRKAKQDPECFPTYNKYKGWEW